MSAYRPGGSLGPASDVPRRSGGSLSAPVAQVGADLEHR